jgi:hypothetical protein
MNEAQILELILNAVSGPASGVAVALLCLVGFGWFLIKHLLPQQEKQLDKVLASHDADRKTFEKSVNSMSRRLDRIEEDVTYIKGKI